MSIYKACDIRGDASSELSPELYRRWGEALGQRLPKAARFVVGGDVRTSTPAFLAALEEGLLSAGVQVFNLGVAPTPLIYFAKQHLGAEGCAIVTASHNPAPMNGLKWLIGEVPPSERDVQKLRRQAEAPAPPTDARSGGSAQALDLEVDYRAWLQDHLQGRPRPSGLRVVIDSGGGCWAERARRILQLLFPEASVSAIHDWADGSFADRDPDCSIPSFLTRLREAVLERKAHLGVAFDGDGDRVAFVDESGHALTAEETTWVLLHSFGGRWNGQPFVHDLKFSSRIPEAARQLGAAPISERSGHAFIRTAMLRHKGLFGAEVSGHYFFGELLGGDDALLTACWMLGHLAGSARTLSEQRKASPQVFMSPDIRMAVQATEREAILARLRAAFAEHPQTFVDGVRIEFPHGWALARPSITQSTLTWRFEGDSAERLEEIQRELCRVVPELEAELRGAWKER